MRQTSAAGERRENLRVASLANDKLASFRNARGYRPAVQIHEQPGDNWGQIENLSRPNRDEGAQ
jgi:hypothetical protein